MLKKILKKQKNIYYYLIRCFHLLNKKYGLEFYNINIPAHINLSVNLQHIIRN